MLRFRQVARKARVISDDGCPVIVPYGRGKLLIEEIRSRTAPHSGGRFDRFDLRRLQRFMVSVRNRDFMQLQGLGLVTELLPNLDIFVLSEGIYNIHLGIVLEQRPTEDFLI